MKVRFFVTKPKSQRCSIYVRFWDSNRIDLKTRTGLTVNFLDWSKIKEEVKHTSIASDKDYSNKKLRELKNYILEEYNIDYNSNNEINSSWLKNKVNDFFDRKPNDELHKVYFYNWVKKYIDDAPTRTSKGKAISPTRINRYTVVMNKIEVYQNYSNRKLRFKDIDMVFYNDFLKYFRTIEKLTDNTIGSYISIIKFWCKNIELEGLPINNYYKHSDFAATSNKTKDVYLNEDEIYKIYTTDFSHSEKYDNVRDNFIIGLRTGLRISDFLNKLKVINIKGDYIEIETTKTEHNVVIPMHPQVKEILEKRNGELPRKISDAKFNLYVKEVCKEAGITEKVEGAKMENKKEDTDYFENGFEIKNKNRKEYGLYSKYELITSHVCRRSFATNLYGKLPNLNIMAITGHKTETQFLKYIKITPKEHALKLKELWTKQEILE
ncbi:site-specific integrase [Flavobacterium sp. N2270]|uniref:site-specific integrase n=1 Tax=Flavobacterium sp. N2270 TaxID=2986831 RepID=UPI002223F135|nr:site-specific integrase [Flavobacterium sp. N2270]